MIVRILSGAGTDKPGGFDQYGILRRYFSRIVLNFKGTSLQILDLKNSYFQGKPLAASVLCKCFSCTVYHITHFLYFRDRRRILLLLLGGFWLWIDWLLFPLKWYSVDFKRMVFGWFARIWYATYAEFSAGLIFFYPPPLLTPLTSWRYVCVSGGGKCYFWWDFADVVNGWSLSRLNYGIPLKCICSTYPFESA